MNELQAQKLVIDAVREYGGAGWKLSNRFLVGIPDLLLCLPLQTVGIWEVKIGDMPKRDNHVKLAITPLQEKTLNDLHNAGGFCGVISFLREGSGLRIAAYWWPTVKYEDQFIGKFVVSTLNHLPLRRGQREQDIVEALEGQYGYYLAR